MRKIIINTISSLLCLFSYSQEKEVIKSDLKINDLLGKNPFKTYKNGPIESLLYLLYYEPQKESVSKIGFMNTKGKIVIKPKYNMASDFFGEYANIIKDSTSYGYIDKKGNETILKDYIKCYFYYGDTGIAKKNGKYGLINRKGEALTEFKYIMIYFYGFNHFKAHLPNKINCILDSNGKVIFNENDNYFIDSQYFIKDSLLIIEEKKTKLKGLANLKNEILISLTYEDIKFTNDNLDLIVAKKNKKYGVLNKNGLEIIPFNYDEIKSNINEDLIIAKKNKKWGFIDTNNEVIIPFMYDDISSFNDGLAFVGLNNKYGYIDKKNEIKIEFNYEKCNFPFFINNLAMIKKNGLYGFIDIKSKEIIPTIYNKAYPFINEFTYIELNNKSGFIDLRGKNIIPFQQKQFWLESEGLIRFVE